MMNKIYLFCLAVLTVLVTACNKEEDVLDPEKDNITKKICFDSDVYLTRADGNAPTALNNQLNVIGQMTKGGNIKAVFNNVPVTYSPETGWSYGTPEYWDFGATRYDFIAYSTSDGSATVADATINGFTVNSDNKDYLFKFYFSDKVGVEKAKFGDDVKLAFNQLAAKVRLEFYESIDGYAVKDLTFKIYTESNAIPSAGPYAVTYDNNNKPVLTHQPKDDKSNLTNELSVAQIASGNISENATECSSTVDCLVLPMSAPSTKLKVYIHYTTVASNGTVSEKEKNGVLANSIDWKYQHRYVYKLQITDTDVNCVQYSDSEWDNDYRH